MVTISTFDKLHQKPKLKPKNRSRI